MATNYDRSTGGEMEEESWILFHVSKTCPHPAPKEVFLSQHVYTVVRPTQPLGRLSLYSGLSSPIPTSCLLTGRNLVFHSGHQRLRAASVATSVNRTVGTYLCPALCMSFTNALWLLVTSHQSCLLRNQEAKTVSPCI